MPEAEIDLLPRILARLGATVIPPSPEPPWPGEAPEWLAGAEAEDPAPATLPDPEPQPEGSSGGRPGGRVFPGPALMPLLCG